MATSKQVGAQAQEIHPITRGVFVVDKELDMLRTARQERDFYVISWSGEKLDDATKQQMLTGRIIVTRRPQKFFYDGARFCYSVIDVAEVSSKSPGDLAGTIAQAISEFSTFHYPPHDAWLLKLLPDGKHLFMELPR